MIRKGNTWRPNSEPNPRLQVAGFIIFFLVVTALYVILPVLAYYHGTPEFSWPFVSGFIMLFLITRTLLYVRKNLFGNALRLTLEEEEIIGRNTLGRITGRIRWEDIEVIDTAAALYVNIRDSKGNRISTSLPINFNT